MRNLHNRNIKELLPHREPFLFIDKVLSIEPGCVTATKYIKEDEEYFKGHFPSNPLVPGVLIVESMAQASGIACASYSEDQNNPEIYFLSRISDVKFKHPVFPGENLIIKSEVIQHYEPFFKVKVSCEVNDKVIAEGELVLTKQKGGAE